MRDSKIAKTILVVYTNCKSLNKSEIGRTKKYSFNTTENIRVGDKINSPQYDTEMLVVKILPRAYKYYNSSTGKMSNTFNSTLQWEIRPLVLRDVDETTVYGSLI